jgi:hypothetical protein
MCLLDDYLQLMELLEMPKLIRQLIPQSFKEPDLGKNGLLFGCDGQQHLIIGNGDTINVI